MAKQRISFVIQQAADEVYLLNFLKQLKPTSIGVIDNPALLRKILDAVPEIEIGWLRFFGRDANDEGRLWERGDEAIEMLFSRFRATGLHHRAYLYVMNEPVEHGLHLRQMMEWLVKLLKMARQVNIRCVAGNLGVGVYEQSEIDAGYFDDYLRELEDGYHIAGFHEYGPPILSMGAAGKLAEDMLDKAKVQPDKWPSPWDVQVSKTQQPTPGSMEANHFVGRVYRWDARAMHLGIRPPRKLITEAGPDRLDAILPIYQKLEQRYKRTEFRDGKNATLIVPWPHIGMRGINTLRWVWEDYYKDLGWTFERTALEFFKWLVWVYNDTIYRQGHIPEGQRKPSIEGVNLFVWTTPTKPDWGQAFGFDYSALYDLHQLMVAWTEELEAEEPAPDPEPEPEPTPDPDPDPTPLPIPIVLGIFTAEEALMFAHAELLESQAASERAEVWRKYAQRLQQPAQ